METSRENTAEYPLLFSAIKKLAGNKELLRRMDTVPRYERYFTGPGEKIWDMDERGHAINTYKIVNGVGKDDLKAGRLNQDEFDRLRIAALIHDLGEIEAGDVSYDEKKTTDETAEKKSFEQKLTDYFPKITDDEKRLVLEIYHNITQNKDRTQKLAKYFNLIERLGYLSNGIEVFLKKPEGVDWQWMVGNILHNQGKHLVKYFEEFESAKKYFALHKQTLADMLKFAQETKTRDFTDEDVADWEKILEMI
jgi:5'-deoxynucleotidase YfbR-like HD superfamily hydrolase